MRHLQLLILLFPFSLFSFDEFELNKTLKNWEKEKSNRTIALITSPSSGKIEYAYAKKNAFTKKLPAGSILKTLSSFVFLANPEKFNVSLEKNFTCNGKFEEPSLNYFTIEDKEKFNLIQNEKSGKYYFRCSVANGHGEITIPKALALSCNAYYLHFASLNPDFFYRTLVNSWKLNEGTGASFDPISIHPISKEEHGSPFTSTLASIGDAGKITVTALKIAQIYGAIFAETPILKPILKGETPEKIYPFPYSETLRGQIKEALRLTITEGTLKNLHLKNTSIQILGGKTGTPTQDGGKFQTHGWNILYFQKGDTPYLLVVFIEKGSGKKEAMEVSTLILNLL